MRPSVGATRLDAGGRAGDRCKHEEVWRSDQALYETRSPGRVRVAEPQGWHHGHDAIYEYDYTMRAEIGQRPGSGDSESVSGSEVGVCRHGNRPSIPLIDRREATLDERDDRRAATAMTRVEVNDRQQPSRVRGWQRDCGRTLIGARVPCGLVDACDLMGSVGTGKQALALGLSHGPTGQHAVDLVSDGRQSRQCSVSPVKSRRDPERRDDTAAEEALERRARGRPPRPRPARRGSSG